jgi:large subunit ribosomal protein L28
MARDQITGKGKLFGHNVIPNSQRKTNRAQEPNLQKKTFIVNGRKVRLKVAASTIRTLRKKGITSNLTTDAKTK